MARKKPIQYSTCRHVSCGEPIYYNDFIEAWCHLRTADPNCRLAAEPVDTPDQPKYSASYGTGVEQ